MPAATTPAIRLAVTKTDDRIDSRLLAAHLGIQHESVARQLVDYASDFEALGVLRFQVGKPGASGGRPERFALLTEDQAYLALAFSRNTAKVRALKVRLVQAFREARAAREMNQTEYLPGYHRLHDQIAALAAGSEHERHVHQNFNRLINKAVGVPAGQRKVAPLPVKSMIVVAQHLAVVAAQAAGDHREAYQLAKHALEPLRAMALGGAE